MKKKYIIVGSNNHWYTQVECKSKDLIDALRSLSEDIKQGSYGDDDRGFPRKLHAFPISGNKEVIYYCK